VYTAVGDYPNALASHKQCVQLVKQMGDRLQEAREIGNVGAVYLAMGEFESAVDCHTQHLRLARRLGNQVCCDQCEGLMVFKCSNHGSLCPPSFSVLVCVTQHIDGRHVT